MKITSPALYVKFHDTDMRLNEVCKTFIFTVNWLITNCLVVQFSVGITDEIILLVKDEVSRPGHGGAVKIFTDVSSGGKVSRKEHSVKVTLN